MKNLRTKSQDPPQINQNDSERYLHQIAFAVGQIDDSVMITNPDGIIVYVNNAFVARTGFSEEEALGQTPRILKSGLHDSAFYAGLWKDILAGRQVRAMFTNRTKGGDLFHERKTITPLMDRSGVLTHFISTGKDVTKQVEAERALNESRSVLRQAHRALWTLSSCNQALIRAESEAQLLDEICRVIVQKGGYRFAWVGYAKNDAGKTVTPVAQFGFEEGYLEKANISWADTPRGRGPTGTAIRTGKISACRNVLFDPFFAPWREEALSRGYESSIVLPLNEKGVTFGALNIYATEPDAFSAEEEALLSELADDLAYGIVALRLRDERAFVNRALKDSEERFKALFEYAPDAYYLMDDSGTFIAGNAATEQLTGYTRSELIGKNFLKANLLSPENLQRAELAFTSLLKGKPIEEKEYVLHKKDGGRVIVDLRTHLMNFDGRIIILGIARDITERIRAQETLRESEHRFRSIFERAKDVIYMIDSQARLFRLSPAFKLITGWKPEERLGIPFLEIVHPDDRHRAMEIFRQVIDQHRSLSFDMRIAKKNGDYWDGEFNVSPFNEGGEEFLFGIGRDITERRRTEQKMREQAELIDIASDAIILRDLDDRILFWNKGAERIYGWAKNEAIGKKANELFYREDPETHHELRENLLAKGFWEGELIHTTKNGGTLTIQSRWTLMRGPQGEPTSILSVNTDITQQKSTESQLLRAQRLDSLGTLAGGIAHDLNNVLGPILLATGVMRRKIHDPAVHTMIDAIDSSATRGADLIKQILSFARGIQGERVSIQLRHIIGDIRTIIKEVFPKNIALQITFPKEFWTVSGDATQLHQVFMNLCVNARDAMPNGGILDLSGENIIIDAQYAAMHPGAKVGAFVRINVKDTGTGIPPEIKDRIFEPFFTTKGVGRGTGLGLPTVFTVVKNHGGFIDVDSEMGMGATFRVYLPAEKMTAKDEKDDVEATQSETGNGELILVVDDEKAIREITKTTLEACGFAVLTAADGTDAISLYAEHKNTIALVITDIIMPLMDGYATIRALKKLDPKVKILAVSGLDKREKMFDGEPDIAFLQKPYTSQKLLESVKALIGVAPHFSKTQHTLSLSSKES